MKLIKGPLGQGLTLSALTSLVKADMYLHHPAGSNNRLNEESRAVTNDNRLYDSQNNNRFGYNQQGGRWYEGSTIDIQWTSQHSCGVNSNVNCDVVIQYACGDEIRDGQTTNTIPENQSQCANNDCNTDFEYGMHENYQNWQHCHLRNRNERVFPADRHLNNRLNARFTRQEENGERYGYECNEERDYYPYWHPTIWKDIAVLTDVPDRCDYYRAESENVKGRSYCHVSDELLNAITQIENRNREHYYIPINETACIDFADNVNNGFVQALRSDQSFVVHELDQDFSNDLPFWTTTEPHNLPEPDCIEAPLQRDNHLGNVGGRELMTYKWKIPYGIAHESCVFRVRYNISSTDYDGWTTTVDHKIRDDEGCMCRNNYGVDLFSQHGFTGYEAKRRGYRHQNDPLITPFPGLRNFRVRVPYNTNQLGRVFEDRSFNLKFVALPQEIKDDLEANPDRKIHNLNARGKIGNYNEVYPNVEYDYVPARTVANVGDYIHIQWSGSDTNNPANDGSQENRFGFTEYQAQRKDRHNIVAIENMSSMWPDFENVASIFGFDSETAYDLAFEGIRGGDNEYLQAGGAAFDLGLRQLETAGTWRFMSTHNNRFGVRTQKGKVIVNGTTTQEGNTN